MTILMDSNQVPVHTTLSNSQLAGERTMVKLQHSNQLGVNVVTMIVVRPSSPLSLSSFVFKFALTSWTHFVTSWNADFRCR
jgi:hypothetical protein